MKAIRAIVFVLIISLIVFLLVAALAPGNYEVERSIHIDASIEKVYEYTINLNNYDDWNPWIRKETVVQSSILGSGSSIGTKYSWEGDRDSIGSGYMVINELIPDKRLVLDMFFISPWEVHAENIIEFSIDEEGTMVKWIMKGQHSYPFERFMMLFNDMDKSIGPDFEQGLKNLKDRFSN